MLHSMIQELLVLAHLKNEVVRPIRGTPWEQCVTVEGNQVLLWYDDEGGSTHVVMIDKDPDMPIQAKEWDPDLDQGYHYRTGDWDKLYSGPKSLEESFNINLKRRCYAYL